MVNVLRVEGADESYLLAEDIFGMSAPIQYAWVLDGDPGVEAVADLHAALERGTLNRGVVRTRVPVARHRWVRSTATLPLGVDDTAIGANAVGDWVDAVLRGAQLRPVDGQGWRLDTVATEDGKRVVSLLVSHMVADGQAVYRALAAAAARRRAALPEPDSGRGLTGLRQDVADAGRQLGAAAVSVRLLLRESVRGLTAGMKGQARPGAAPPPAETSPTSDQSRGGADTTLAIVDVDRDAWHGCAREYGGTSSSLFTGLMAGVLQRSGYPVGEETKVCIAVSNRDTDPDVVDDRANASGGVWIRIPGVVEPGMALSDIRSRSKKAFIDYAESGADQVADNVAPVVRLLPRRVVGRLMRAIAGPDTTVSSLGVAPPETTSIGGVAASSFAIRAIMQGTPADQRRKQGPAVAAWAVEYADHVTLTFFGIHPDYFGDQELLRKIVDHELSSWGIAHTFW